MPTRIKRLVPYFHPSALLFLLQLLLLILYAIFDEPQGERELIRIFSIVTPMMVVWVVRHSPGADWIAWSFAIPAFILAIVSAVFARWDLYIWTSLLEAPLYFYAAISLIAYMMEDYKVTPDELYAAGAAFTMLASGFAYLFQFCDTFLPGSFISASDPGQLAFIDHLFLSFTNLSSVGISDIQPVTDAARVLLMFEQIVGVGYVAVVVSRLVALTAQRQERRRH